MDAPKNLGAGGRALWSAIEKPYDLRPDELRVLGAACREQDLIDTMQAVLDESDLMIKGSMGQQVVHPLVSEIRQHRTVLAALLRSLKLPDEQGEAKVNQQRSAGQSSWASRRGA